MIAIQAKEFCHLFLGFKIYHNSIPLEFVKIDVYRGVVIWRISLPNQHKNGIKISIEDGAGESLDVDIGPYPFAGNSLARIMQQVMQKDYPAVWIRDHILYMHRLHGIDRYIVYDNGSSGYSGLIESLRDISENEGIEIVAINWPFPYHRGSTTRCSSAQKGAFNHGFYMFKKFTEYAMNLDIDEYLFNHSLLSLYSCIKVRAFLNPIMLISEVIIRNYPDDRKIGTIRANSFSYPEKITSRQTKYIYKADTKCVKQLGIHRAFGVQVMGFFVKTPVGSLLFWGCAQIGRILIRMTVPSFREDSLGYYHFRGINTGWKKFLMQNSKKTPEVKRKYIDTLAGSKDLMRLENFDSEWEPFDYIKRAFKKIGLD